MTDVMLAGHCASGVRRWFRERGLDFRDFMRNGMEANEFARDALTQRVVDLKIKREGSRG